MLKVCVLSFCFTCSEVESKALEKSSVSRSKDGKCEMILPIGVPDEGTYDVVDQFLKKSPGKYCEISERAIHHWCSVSGILHGKDANMQGGDKTNDKPASYDTSVDPVQTKKTLVALAKSLRRNVVIMGVADNLTAEARKKYASEFTSVFCTKKALVSVGKPPKDYAEAQREQERALLQKKADATVDNQRKVEKVRRDTERKKKQTEQATRRAKRTSDYEAAKKKYDEAKEAEKDKEEDEKDKDLVAPEEPVDSDEEIEEESVEDKFPYESVTLGDDVKFRSTGRLPDISQGTLSQNFIKFSLPTEEEGYQVRHVCRDGLWIISMHVE